MATEKETAPVTATGAVTRENVLGSLGDSIVMEPSEARQDTWEEDAQRQEPVEDFAFPQGSWGDSPPPSFMERRPLVPVNVPKPNAYRYNDSGNADRFARMYFHKVAYVSQWKRWVVYDGQRWKLDSTNEAYRLAQQSLAIARTALTFKGTAHLLDHDEEKKFRAFLSVSESHNKVNALLGSAATHMYLFVESHELDADPWKLNVKNGTIDLQTGELLDHHLARGITKMAPVRYFPDAECPEWEAFIKRAMQGDEEMIRYLQRAVGYTLVGDQGEKCYFMPYGPTDTGKTKFITTLHDLLGEDYGHKAATELLIMKRGGGVPNDVAALRGKRLVTTDEIGEGQRLNVPLVKRLTGGDVIAARFLYGEYFNFRAECTIWIDTNEKPTIKETDDAIWNRVMPIPFLEQIPKREQDRFLSEKFRGELAGILRWAVEGCLAWQREGLNPPDKIGLAKSAYRIEEDELGRFIDDCCEVGEDRRADKTELFKAFCKWSNNYSISRKLFTQRMERAGWHTGKSGKFRYWAGLELDPGFRIHWDK